MSEILRRAGYHSTLADVGTLREARPANHHTTNMPDGDLPVFDQEQAEFGYPAQSALPKETPMPESLLHAGEPLKIL